MLKQIMATAVLVAGTSAAVAADRTSVLWSAYIQDQQNLPAIVAETHHQTMPIWVAYLPQDLNRTGQAKQPHVCNLTANIWSNWTC